MGCVWSCLEPGHDDTISSTNERVTNEPTRQIYNNRSYQTRSNYENRSRRRSTRDSYNARNRDTVNRRHVPSVPSIGRYMSSVEKSVPNPHLFGIGFHAYYESGSAVTFETLDESETKYVKIANRIPKKKFRILTIEKVKNPYLQKAYMLRKEQKSRMYENCEVLSLFHGSTEENISSICKENFSWRYYKRYQFGRGVCFSRNFTYASNYSDENKQNKVMLLANVLVSKSCIGNENMHLPIDDCDTSQKGEDGIVIVKYDDNEFYPKFRITYCNLDPSSDEDSISY